MKKVVFLSFLTMFVAMMPFLAGLCQGCSGEGQPCSPDGVLGKCCPTYTNNNGETRKLKCSTDPKTENTCVDNGPINNR